MKKALATLLYSGTPQEAQDFGIPFTIRQLQRVNATRNTLVFSHVTGVPPAPPGVSRCSKCALLDQCAQVSELLSWEAPHLPGPATDEQADDDDVSHVPAQQTTQPREAPVLPPLSPADRDFFALYYRLLQQEGFEIERQQARLWQTSVEARVEGGSAISGLIPLGAPTPTEQGEWQQTFRCVNTSELREGDEVLLSDGNPVTGEVVTGTILSISSEQVSVWTPERIAHPALLDRYDTNIVHVRTLQNLLRWLQADEHLRGLVSGTLVPRFAQIQVAPRPDFNDEQNLAVARALQMRDYLLVHGPPGTGKTSVIAEIVKRLCQRGERVLLAGFTNQAVDNMLQRLEREGFHDYIRLGHERSVDEAVRPRLWQVVSSAQAPGETPPGSAEIRALLRRSPVVASTTATWSSDKYAPPPLALRDVSEDALFSFDVALIDEAGQLTIPAILGALRFARRFILVGDEKQLPPLVLDKAAGAQGLAVSLFERLKRLDEERQSQAGQAAVSACVPLRVQYRMHETISNFASRTFYRNQLRAHYAVARRRLHLQKPLLESVQTQSAVLQALRPDLPMTFLDVQTRGNKTEVKMSSAEARAVREIVGALLARGVAEDEIGIIAPYRAQVANLRRHLLSDDPASGWQALSVKSPLSIDTVDRFQGGERSVMIISFATSSPPPKGSQLREHLTNAHRLNVALTRAQRKLILVGNANALAEMELFRRLLAYCQEQRAFFAYASASTVLNESDRAQQWL
jgi:DNA replication ATP-dependent helicase Dna2